MEYQDKSALIIKSWADYVKLSAIEKGRFNAQDLVQQQQLLIKHDMLTEDETGVQFELPASIVQYFLSHHLSSVTTQGTTPLQINFPVIKVVEAERTYFCSLFSYSIPEQCWATTPTLLHLPVKQGELVDAISTSFSELLDIDIKTIGGDRHACSVMAACCEYSSPEFTLQFSNFLRWVKKRLGVISTQKGIAVSLETGFNMLITTQTISDYNSKKLLDDFEFFGKTNLPSYPLLNQYIQQQAPDRQIAPQYSGYPYGLFEKEYPLARGQIQTLCATYSEQALIAVQGAPGTGKTTLFKSLIASLLVKRALSIIAGTDNNLGMVVSSTAIKAIENVIDDLRHEPELAGIHWLYFQSGDKDQVEKELLKIEKLKEQLVSEKYEQNKQQATAKELLCLKGKIDHCNRDYQRLNNQLKSLNISDLSIAEWEKNRAQMFLDAQTLIGFSNQPNLLSTLERHCAQQLETIGEDIKQQLNRQIFFAKAYLQLPVPPFDKKTYITWLNSELSELIQHHFLNYPTHWFIGKLIPLVNSEPKRIWHHLQKNYAPQLKQFGLDKADFQLWAALAKNRQYVLNEVTLAELQQHQITIPSDIQTQLIQLQKIHNAVKELLVQERNIQLFRKLVIEQRQLFPEGDWLEVLRLRFVAEHRAMFELAVDYLWQELLKRKQTVIEVLNLWTSQMTGQKDSSYYHWKNNISDFYQLLSLAYPVIAAPLASVYKVAGFKSLEDFKTSKPHYICLLDEAGMVSVESMLPLLARSDKAIVVGDPLQIEPIRNLSDTAAERLRQKYYLHLPELYEAMSPTLVTSYHRAAGTKTGQVTDSGAGIVLNEHRRCHPVIADLFMSIAGYKNLSILSSPAPPRIELCFQNMGAFPLMFYSVQGKQGALLNTNQDEVNAIGELLDKLETAGYDLTKDIGIITPYSNQKDLLLKQFGKRLNHNKTTKIGTVHQFQGTGFEVIIYSSVIFRRSDKPQFQNSKPNLLNVAVSRAKQQFIVVGNYQRLMSAGHYLKKLAENCARHFLIEMELPSQRYLEWQNPALRRFQDCEHIDAFKSLLEQARESFMIVVPWIRSGRTVPHPPLELLQKALDRGVKIYIFYGYNDINLGQEEDGDPALIQQYRQLLSEHYLIRLPEGTHEKLLMVDNSLVVIGSWNWLSHAYYKACSCTHLQNLKIRRESSLLINDPKQISELRDQLLPYERQHIR